MLRPAVPGARAGVAWPGHRPGAGSASAQHAPPGHRPFSSLDFLCRRIGTATSFLEADVAGGYYDAQYNYRMSFSPIAMHIHLLLHYATSEAAPIGRGFDKWWVFLSKAGVSAGALWIIACVLLAWAAASGVVGAALSTQAARSAGPSGI